MSTFNDVITIPVSPSNVMSFFKIVGKLKNLKRTGWVVNNVELPESVADHMYRMSMMSFMITDKNIDTSKLMKICLVHDLAESIVGDITPHDNISKEEKRKMEEDAMHNIINNIDNKAISQEILDLFLEYENGVSNEAIIAKQLDKLEMIIQANEYEISQGKNLQEFFTSTHGCFFHPEIASWAKELIDQRQQRIHLQTLNSMV